jgi:diguanylate cyclase (GGDEF)-like protein
MLYLGIFVLISLVGYIAFSRILRYGILDRQKLEESLLNEYNALLKKNAVVSEENREIDRVVSETIALYDITKDVCKTLDDSRIFPIFKDKIKNYLNLSDCRLIDNEADLSRFKGYIIFPLTVSQESIGYLVASGIEEKDRDKFHILSQQFLTGIKRSILYKKVQELSITDSLTQLFSRRHFLERLKEEFKRSKKFRLNTSFFMIDIDKFKNFNDRYGHLVGDAILRDISRTVKETVRQIDFVGRFGGEEIAVVLAETDRDQARFAAERLRQAIENNVIKVYDEELRVTVSIGVATYPQDADDVDTLIENADKALYVAKQTGRNKVCAFTLKNLP